MNIYIYYFNLSLLLFLLEKLYLYLARLFRIEAVPNVRSAHSIPTLLGGGVIIPIACLIYFFLSGYVYPFWMLALFCLAAVCFIDDLKDISVSLRIITQAAAAAVLLIQFQVYSFPLILIPLVLMTIVVSLNVYNFLDGINGMMSANSFVHLACLYYINQYTIHFIDDRLLILVGIAVIVFSYFNFRSKAVCFAGDVGSISMAFFVCGCVLKLILVSGNLIYINLLLVYYLDAVTTFAFRWMQGHDVFKAHNKHFYLYLVNYQRWSHLTVATVYAGGQLIISVSIILIFSSNTRFSAYYNIYYTALTIAAAALLFILLRIKLEGAEIFKRLPKHASNHRYGNQAFPDQ